LLFPYARPDFAIFGNLAIHAKPHPSRVVVQVQRQHAQRRGGGMIALRERKRN
jgi:hypothetical protein